MQQYDGPGAAIEPPPAPVVPPDPPHRRRHRAARLGLALLLAGVLGLGLALAVTRLVLPADQPTGGPAPTGSGSGSATPSSSSGPSSPSAAAAARTRAVQELLTRRAAAVTARDRAGFLATVDPAHSDFYAHQAELFDRVAGLELAQWSYQLVGDGPGLTGAQAASLPSGSAIVRVRLTYRLAGTETTTDREQYLTVVPSGDQWLFANDTDGSASGLDTERDLWDLGPVRALRGESSLVLADTRGASKRDMQRLADEADLAVHDVDTIWSATWSREPVVILPRSQEDMATLIDSNGDGLAQIAAVTTGSFESGESRGDRIVINPAAWNTLGQLGRRVVLTHEMTHVATRATSVQSVPIWLSEGFADYVAYRATPVPTTIVASDVLKDVRDGKMPTHLPDAADFDASKGDIAASYEGAWLACRMIAERYGQKRLVRLYSGLADSAGPGWPEEAQTLLGVGQTQLVRDWKAYLRARAAA